MTDIRTAAQREAAWRTIDPNVDDPLPGDHHTLGWRKGFAWGAAWGAERITPTREQIAEALYNQEGAPLGRWSQVGEMQHGWLECADAVLALMQGLAEGESS